MLFQHLYQPIMSMYLIDLLCRRQVPVRCPAFLVRFAWFFGRTQLAEAQDMGSTIPSKNQQNTLLRVIPSLTHSSDIVSDIPSGSIYGIYIYIYNYIYSIISCSDILSYILSGIYSGMSSDPWGLPIASGPGRRGEEEK